MHFVKYSQSGVTFLALYKKRSIWEVLPFRLSYAHLAWFPEKWRISKRRMIKGAASVQFLHLGCEPYNNHEVLPITLDKIV